MRMVCNKNAEIEPAVMELIGLSANTLSGIYCMIFVCTGRELIFSQCLASVDFLDTISRATRMDWVEGSPEVAIPVTTSELLRFINI